ncbi:MAG: septum site-determining protein MinC [Lachnospiraceae bacterium]
MEQQVILKSNRYGINLILNEQMPFEELLEAIILKFHESDKFFKNAKIGISFSGRKLSTEEEIRIVDAITESTSIQILCVLENDEQKELDTKAQIEEVLRRQDESTGQFYKGTLRSGQVLESETSIVIIGDVNPGAKIVAKGNIVVLGSLDGSAYAGAAGNPDSFVAALHMNPIQIKIADIIGRSEDKSPLERLRGRKKHLEPQVAYVKDEAIYIDVMRNGVFENFY